MEFKIIKRENGSKRYLSVPEGISMTDQSDTNMVNINTIMDNYRKTGLLPNFPERIGQYIDTTKIPSYMEAQAQIRAAKELFEALPAKIRKLMNNDPKNLETFIQDEDNQSILLKYGLIHAEKSQKTEKDKVDSKLALDDPTSGSAGASKKADDAK